MKKNSDNPVIAWLILVYDSTAEERFPLKRKWYRFSFEKASDDEVAALLRLLNQDEPEKTQSRPGLKPGQTVVTVSISGGGSLTSREILRYRHLFEPETEEALGSGMETSPGFRMVMLPPDSYFEDENGKPISLMEIHDREAKRKGEEDAFAIILDRPETILRLGPAEPIRPELWSGGDADLLAQFFSTYRFLIRSRWLQSRCEVSPAKKGVHSAVLPLHEDCMSVILPFRQLYSSDGADNLFNRCCNIHSRHCIKGCAQFWWVRHYKKAFNSYLDGPPKALLVKADIPVRRYLDAVAYGACIVHATSRTAQSESDLKALLQANGRERVALGYHFILHTLLGHISQALQVIQQDVHYWTADMGWASSGRLAAQDVFGDTADSQGGDHARTDL